MLHTVNSLTIRKYGEIDRTGNLSLLRKWYNVFPVSWFDYQKTLSTIGQLFNKGIDKTIINEVAKLISYNNILILEALHSAIYNLIVLKAGNDVFKKKARKTENLRQYLLTVKEITGIEIKDIAGLDLLKKETQRRIDKYHERYRTIINNDSIPFTQFAYSVFVLIEMPYNPDMLLSEFADLVIIADKKAKSLEKIKSKNG